ncbi:MAG: hypothetical protein ACE5F1_17345 [Planctomycetota bacterium]
MATEAHERFRLFTKLFTLLPMSNAQGASPKALIAAYVEETRDIPAIAISHALSTLTRQADRIFTPTTGEIRKEAAAALRRQRLRLAGIEHPESYLASRGDPPANFAREFACARDELLKLEARTRS